MLDTIGKKVVLSQFEELKKLGGRINRFGADFAIYDAQGQLVFFSQPAERASTGKDEQTYSRPDRKYQSDLNGYGLGVLKLHRLEKGSRKPEHTVYRFGRHKQVLAVVLLSQTEAEGVAVIDLGEKHATEENVAVFEEILRLLAENFRTNTRASQQIEMISSELAQTYEELVLLHKLSTNMKLTEPDSNYLQMACDNLTDIVSVEGIAILLAKTIDGDRKLVITAGSGLIDIDEQTAMILEERLLAEINAGRESMLDSEVDCAFKYDWPENIKNIIAVPLYGKDKPEPAYDRPESNPSPLLGLMVAINRLNKQDFDSTDVKLFNSVANGCAVFVENGKLFRDIKELFVGSLKALTNSIDAKDQYTRGHSERVAFISRWIAERLSPDEPLPEEQIHKIYLAGVLHDIGKMGIDEAILHKTGKLTERELKRIKTHPLVGAGILNEIKQMHDIVPGVLCHHERIDGHGYPHGLKGEQIPMIGKIIKLADSFDAMTSRRSYRDAMRLKSKMDSARNLMKRLERCF
ncbi:MAG: HD domain-containing phosphohydrolase [Planctomycetota bacterium]|jgi:HD-GYP domain-containing protein (c-di-GMP phosphodiesterase class II)